MKKLAIVTTHPIQYYAPFFRLLAHRGIISIKVFYTWGEQAKEKVFDPGFGTIRTWDVPLLENYDYEFVKNVSLRPGSSHFKGIINPDIIGVIQAFSPDAILVFGWAFQSHLKALRFFKNKIPVFFRGDSTLLDESRNLSVRKIARRLFLTWVYSHVDKVFYVGSNNKAYYKMHGVKDANLLYAPHAVDNDRFFDKNGDYQIKSGRWKQELGVEANKPIVLFAGKLEPKKNPLFLVEAARQLPDMHFVIAGNGALENEVKNGAEALSNVTILPFQNQSQMPVLYTLADIFVLPSKGPGETWGLAMNEAMACGCAIVASEKCGGAIDLIRDGENGYVIYPSSEELIEKLGVLQNATLIQSFSRKSLERIQSFSLISGAQAIESELTK